MTVGKILPPHLQRVAWKRDVERKLDETSPGELSPPVAYTASPYGGSGPPDASWYIPVTAATFDGTQASQPWVTRLDRVCRMGFGCKVRWITDASTTGEVRLWMTGAPNNPTTAIALPAGQSGIATFRWLHGWPPWSGVDPWITIEARRTGGAGNVRIGLPIGYQVGPKGCTVGGV